MTESANHYPWQPSGPTAFPYSDMPQSIHECIDVCLHAGIIYLSHVWILFLRSYGCRMTWDPLSGPWLLVFSRHWVSKRVSKNLSAITLWNWTCRTAWCPRKTSGSRCRPSAIMSALPPLGDEAPTQILKGISIVYRILPIKCNNVPISRDFECVK